MSDSEKEWKQLILPQEAYEHFYKRTDNHIRMVQSNLYLWTLYKPEYFNQLNHRAMLHDESKFREPEKTPYVWRTWQSYCTLNNIPFSYPPGMEQQIRDAIFHHITHNRHHPEWFPDPDEMTTIDLIEMVCDWTAMAQEFGDKSAMGWADRVLGRRFHFSQKKCDLIRDLIIQTDQLVEQDKTYKQALKDIKS
jgi:hypothetical protein